jgi:hypothetical protein
MTIPKFKAPIVYVDCDDTLVSWNYDTNCPGPNKIEFIDPEDGEILYLETLPENIKAIKTHKLRKHTVILWSAGGADWAEEVANKIGLGKSVDAYADKPTWFYDDLPASQFMEEHKRIHLLLKKRKKDEKS